MRYVSTRGEAPEAGFRDVLLTGLAPDGGLYVPDHWPRFSEGRIRDFAGRPYADVAVAIMEPFTEGEIDSETLKKLCHEAYRGFRHPAVTPLIQLDVNAWLLELFHGPTFAFKDLAMQLLARLMDDALASRGGRATIVAATSGDTGGSAVEAYRAAANVDLFVLFPKGRVSPVQQRQMTTANDPNIYPIAIAGSFDDCQALVKGLFGNDRFRREMSLTAVNSINWARILAQTIYYFTASAALGGPDRAVSFCVPTGNFGDVFAGYVASQMGLPIDRLTIATNSNDILVRTLATGRYELREVVATSSPSMDIQVASNFERLLFEAMGRNGAAVARAMERLKQSGSFDIEPAALERIRQRFLAASATEKEMADAVARTLKDTGYLPDPHTAVALSVANRGSDSGSPRVTFATAHPAKFPEAVEAATGVSTPVPPEIAALSGRPERFVELESDLAVVERYIGSHARAASLEA